MATRKAQALPKRIYVKRETESNDPSDSYLVADEDAESMEDGDAVGVYELRETKTMRVTKALE